MKHSLRQTILEKRNALAKQEIHHRSKKIQEHLFELEEYKKSRVVMFYVSFGNEVFTHDMMRESLKHKTVVVPKVVHREIEPSLIISFDQMIPDNKYGILEPIDVTRVTLKSINMVLVPGLVFDTHGHRLGYGFGFYDKFLQKIPHAVKVGLAFDFQSVDEIPKEVHDVPVDVIVTDKEVIRIKK